MAGEQIVGLVNPAIALLFAAAFMTLWVRMKRLPQLLAYGVSYALLAVGFVAFHLVSDPTGFIATVLVHGCYSAACVLLVHGFCARSNRPPPTRTLVFSSVVTTILLLFATTFDADANARMYIANANYGLIFTLGGMALKGGATKDPMTKAMTWIFAATAFQFFVRPTLSFIMAGALTTADYRGSAYYSILVITVAIFAIVLALGLIVTVFYDQLSADRIRAERDPLSGLYMRQPFELGANAMLQRARDVGVPVSMVVADIDYFKRVNDIWGHQAGDEAIASFGRLIADTIRNGDLAGRVGGEEFCIMVWNCPLEPSTDLANRIRRKLTAQEIAHLGPDARLTASFGTAMWKPGESYSKFFGRADQALYRAKASGRNCVCASGQEPDVLQTDDTEQPPRTAAA